MSGVGGVLITQATSLWKMLSVLNVFGAVLIQARGGGTFIISSMNNIYIQSQYAAYFTNMEN